MVSTGVVLVLVFQFLHIFKIFNIKLEKNIHRRKTKNKYIEILTAVIIIGDLLSILKILYISKFFLIITYYFYSQKKQTKEM